MKGSQFERDLCRQFSLWWTSGQRDDVFWRTAGSGAMAKTRSKTGRTTANQYGDIHAVDPIGIPFTDAFTVEAKRGYNKHTFADMIDKPDNAGEQQWEKFLSQVLADWQLAGTWAWLLVVKRDRREPLVFMTTHVAEHLHAHTYKTDTPYVRFHCYLKGGSREYLHGMPLSAFFQLVKPDVIRAWTRSHAEDKKCLNA